jgi:hypothetical protein
MVAMNKCTISDARLGFGIKPSGSPRFPLRVPLRNDIGPPLRTPTNPDFMISYGKDKGGRIMVAKTNKLIVRVVCTVKDAPEDEFPLTFELILQNGSIAKGRAYFGFQGTLNGELRPFVLRPEGQLDYGSDYEDDQDRFITTCPERDLQHPCGARSS